MLGYVQRGGKPSARDKLLANYMSSLAVDQLLAGKTNKAICRRARETVAIDLSSAHKMRRKSYNRVLVSVFNKINQE
ncbi:MAG: hypothetical protein MJ223_02030 [Mycoplasmoidaceae bacterium]|nr:hypothetical protein [Mycoplasmoidaceae bacterium]